jgi:hypothetical protein
MLSIAAVFLGGCGGCGPDAGEDDGPPDERVCTQPAPMMPEELTVDLEDIETCWEPEAQWWLTSVTATNSGSRELAELTVAMSTPGRPAPFRPATITLEAGSSKTLEFFVGFGELEEDQSLELQILEWRYEDGATTPCETDACRRTIERPGSS